MSNQNKGYFRRDKKGSGPGIDLYTGDKTEKLWGFSGNSQSGKPYTSVSDANVKSRDNNKRGS